jgi:serine/threonine protein kinase
MASLKPLCLLKKRYRIIALAGEGGFGTVHRAEDSLLDLPVALKTLKESDDVEGDNGALHLRREAGLLARLKHAGIPGFIDFFEERGHWHLVMEWVDGAHIRVGHPLTVRQVVWVGIQVCAILSYLHSRQRPVIHRDIKPANLRLSTANQLYLVDFGISCYAGINEVAIGSPGYAAPEQWRQGNQITPKADMYGLGMTLRELLTGLAPNDQTSTTQKPMCQQTSTAQNEQPGYRELADLLRGMTAEDPDDRPNVQEVWQKLEILHRMLKEKTYAAVQ